MVGPLREYFWLVEGTDVFDYGKGFDVADFLAEDGRSADWIITNPPFKIAEAVVLQALSRAKVGVAMLVRSVWLEGTGRYERLFRVQPPSIIAQFCERVPMTKGRWDPGASTATSYAWIVWQAKPRPLPPIFTWIPPGCRKGLSRPDDAGRYGVQSDVPLFADPTGDNEASMADAPSLPADSELRTFLPAAE
ncbi:SAM-dependent DNA methyltransferase [Methylobacterium sp. CM6247]